MAGSRTLEVIITGDPSKALAAFGEVDAGTGKLGGSFSTLGSLAVAGFAVVGAAAVGAGVALYEIGSKFDDAYDKIRTGTGATGADLDALKDSFRNVVTTVPTDFGKASDAITKLVQITGDDAGPGLDKLSEQFLELSRITKTDLTANLDSGAHALINWGIPVDEQSSKLDALFRTTQITGGSFADLSGQLNDAGPVLRAAGLNFDQSTALVGALSKAGLSVSDVMPAMSKSLAKAAEEGKPAGQVFADAFDRIKNAPDDVAASGIALEEFGKKAGPKLGEMIRSGALDYQGLMAAIQGGQDTILGAGQDTMDFSEKWELFKNRVLVALEPIAMRVFNFIGDAMDALPGIMARLTPAFERVKEVLSQFLTKLVDFGKWLLDHKPILEGIAVAIGVGLVAAFVAWAASAGAAAVATIAAAAPVILIGAAIAALAAGLIYAYQNFDGFRAVVDNVASWLRDTAWPVMQTVFEAIVSAAQAVISFVQDHWPEIQAAFETVFGAVKTFYDTVVVPLFDAIVATGQTVISFFVDHWDQIHAAFQIAWDALGLYWNNVVVPLFDVIVAYVKTEIDVVVTIFDTIRSSFETAWGAAKAAWDNVGSPIFSAIQGVVGDVKGWFDDLVGFVSGLPGRIGAAASGMWDGISSAFGSAIDIIKGIWNGFVDFWNSIEITIPGIDIPMVGTIGGGTVGLPDLPHAAAGGLFDKPTAVWVGDNSSSPEIVSPVNTLREIFNESKTSTVININRDVYGVDDLRRTVADALAMEV